MFDDTEGIKTELQDKCGNPIARLGNARAHAEELQREVSQVLSEEDASRINGTLQRLVGAIGEQMDSLIEARSLIGAIRKRQESDE